MYPVLIYKSRYRTKLDVRRLVVNSEFKEMVEDNDILTIV